LLPIFRFGSCWFWKLSSKHFVLQRNLRSDLMFGFLSGFVLN
jgi:hypothetical protein